MRLQSRRGMVQQQQQQRGGARPGHRPIEQQRGRGRLGRGAETIGAAASAAERDGTLSDSQTAESLTSAEENGGKVVVEVDNCLFTVPSLGIN